MSADGFESINRTDALANSGSAEADHRIANSLAILASIINRQVKDLPAVGMLAVADVRDMLKELALKLGAVGDLHRFLTFGQRTGLVDLASYLHGVVSSVSHSLTEEKQTAISYDLAPDCAISVSDAIAIGLFTIEAMTNALKYAHPRGETGAIRVLLRSNADLSIEVEDDGVGLPKEFDPGAATSTGLRLMRGIADQNGWHLSFASCPRGLSVRLEMPRHAA